MLVVSDTSPITNLISINRLHLLPKIFQLIVIPQKVFDELCELPHQKIILDQQQWIVVCKAENLDTITELSVDLDPGEAEAISLAIELNADYLIIDEWKGRNKAELLGLRIVGLLGILLKAKQKGSIEAISPLLDELKEKAGFRINPTLYRHVLTLAGELI